MKQKKSDALHWFSSRKIVSQGKKSFGDPCLSFRAQREI
jgi:hypothetical protein